MKKSGGSVFATGWMLVLAAACVLVAGSATVSRAGEDKPAGDKAVARPDCEKAGCEQRKEPKEALVAARREIERRVTELKKKEAELREAGHNEDADRIHEEARKFVAQADQRFEAMKKEIARRESNRKEGGKQSPEMAEGKLRLIHLRAAAQNLKAAGMDDAAHRIAEEAERLEQSLRRDAPVKEPGREVRAEAVEQVQEMHRALRELHAEVESLRREVRELKEHRP